MGDSISVVVAGARGKMGSEVVSAVTRETDLRLVGEVDAGDSLENALVSASPDAYVDFTLPDAVFANVEIALRNRVVPIVGTTGLGGAQLDQIRAWCKEYETGALIAPNFAIGAILLMRFSEVAAKYMPDVEIIEMHHERKLDAPSGTAIKTAEMIARGRGSVARTPMPTNTVETVAGARGGSGAGEVPVHSVRLPGFVASEMVIFGGVGQTLTIRHDSIDRKSFMPGVVLALRAVPQLKANGGELVYGLENLI
jgi:4-hydroxy-tetrahydrodipicolinate reductase